MSTTAIAAAKPKLSLKIPCTKGITAPPTTPMIISAETSFARPGNRCSAKEKMMEKTLAIEKPMMKITTHNSAALFTIIKTGKAITASDSEEMRNFAGFV